MTTTMPDARASGAGNETAAVQLDVVTRRALRDDVPARTWHDPDDLLSIGERARRMILESPFRVGDDEPVQVIARLGDRVAGRLNLVAGALIVDGSPVHVLWGSGLIVSPAARGRGLGQRLIATWEGLHHTAAGCGTAHVAQMIYRKRGWLEIGMPRHIALCRSRSVVDHHVSNRVMRRVVASGADAGLYMHRRLLHAWTSIRARDHRLEPLDRVSEELDALLSAPRGRVCAHRSSSWFNWLLSIADGAERRNTRLILVRGRDDSPLGLMLLRRRFHAHASGRGYRDVMLGSLKDLLVLDTDRTNSCRLTLLAHRALIEWDRDDPGERRLDAIELCATASQDSRSLRRLGCPTMGEVHVVCHARADSPLSDPGLADRTAWAVSPAEGDNIFN